MLHIRAPLPHQTVEIGRSLLDEIHTTHFAGSELRALPMCEVELPLVVGAAVELPGVIPDRTPARLWS